MNPHTRRLFLKLLALFPLLRRIFAPAPDVVIDTMPDRGEKLVPNGIDRFMEFIGIDPDGKEFRAWMMFDETGRVEKIERVRATVNLTSNEVHVFLPKLYRRDLP